MSRILMVSAYPPVRDGIAAYAVQEVKRLRSEGHDVSVLSPWPSAAHEHLDLRGPRGPLALAKRVRGYDRVVVQYHPDVFYRQSVGALDRFLTTAALVVAFALAHNVELRVHEIDYRHGRPTSPNGWLARVALRTADAVTVHTEPEQREISRAYGLPPGKVQLLHHGGHFERHTDLDRSGARRRLGLPDDELMFLSIGFIQPHKGFDRALRAFAGLGEFGCRLDVVGSVRVEESGYLEYLHELRDLVGATAGAHLHDRFVSDEEFDVWLVAADVVVLPYRHIWSSSVASRAALFDRPVIATRVGGLEDQLPEGTVLVEDDHDLAIAMRRAATQHAGVVPPDPEGDEWPAGDATQRGGERGAQRGGQREAVQSAIRQRALRDRGGRPPLGVATRHLAPGGPRLARTAGADPLASLRRLPPAGLAPPTSARPLASAAKRIVRRLTYWELEPIVRHANALQRATLDALEDLRGKRDGAGGGR